MIELVYWAMVACFFTHELDAVRRHEWHIIPVVKLLPEKQAEQVFMSLHVPLVLAVFWYSREGGPTLFPLGLSIFAILHVALHWSFRKHPKNEFNGLSSWALIVLTGLLGALNVLALVYR
jgi:hypothetical protein